MAEETWRDDPIILESVDRLLRSSSVELDLIMTEMAKNRSATERAQGDMGFALVFCLGLFSVHYAKARSVGEEIVDAWDMAMAQLSTHPLTQNIMAKAAGRVIDQASGVEIDV